MGLLRASSPAGQIDKHGPEIAGVVQRFGEVCAFGIVAAGEIDALSVDPGHEPSLGVRPGNMSGNGGDSVEMVGVHVIERRLFGSGKRFESRSIQQEIVPLQQIGLPEAAIEAGALWFKTENREIAKPDIETWLWDCG